MSIQLIGIARLESLERMAKANQDYQKVVLAFALEHGWEVPSESRILLNWHDGYRYIRTFSTLEQKVLVEKINSFILSNAWRSLDLSAWAKYEISAADSLKIALVSLKDGDPVRAVGVFTKDKELESFVKELLELSEGGTAIYYEVVSPTKVLAPLRKLKADERATDQGSSCS